MYYQVFHDARPSLARVRALAWGRVGVRAGIRVTVRVRDRVRRRVGLGLGGGLGLGLGGGLGLGLETLTLTNFHLFLPWDDSAPLLPLLKHALVVELEPIPTAREDYLHVNQKPAFRMPGIYIYVSGAAPQATS